VRPAAFVFCIFPLPRGQTSPSRRWESKNESAFAVSVGFLLDALVGHGEVGLPGHAVVVGYLPG